MKRKVSGNPSCIRIITDSPSATRPIAIAVIAYWIAMTLWSWLQMYFVTKVCGSCRCACWSAIATYAIRNSSAPVRHRRACSVLRVPGLARRAGSIRGAREACGRAAQRADVGHEIGGCLFVVEYPRDPRHLRAVEILRVPAANTGPEVVQLSHEVPVTLVGKPRRLGGPYALPFRTVTVGTGHVCARPALGVALQRRTRRVVGQRRDVRRHVCDRRVVEHRGKRHHLRRDGLAGRAATDAVLEIAELLGDVPWVLSRQLRCV